MTYPSTEHGIAMVIPPLPAQLLDRTVGDGEESVYWHWDSHLPSRLHITLFASGEVVFGAFYQLTADRDLVDHILGA